MEVKTKQLRLIASQQSVSWEIVEKFSYHGNPRRMYIIDDGVTQGSLQRRVDERGMDHNTTISH